MKFFWRKQKPAPSKGLQHRADNDGANASSDAGQRVAGKRKILLVDDDQVVLKAMSLKLQANGYQVLTASDGANAVSLVRNESPDLVILDINFPPEVGMSWDGFKIMEWFRGRTDSGGMPVIIITGEDSPRNKERAEEVGAVAFFQKPINTEQLLATIREIEAQQG